MALSAGDKLGPYEILSLVGKGGMGEVYRAHDPRTGRDVAIKISAERFTERFGREVQAVAALNHPNICTLFDVGPNYLVMEFVEGESPKGPVPVEEALRIVRQIAEALAAAHEKGIVHRDLKPANIKIRPDGTLKVLDFGLAKVAPLKPGDAENSPTLSMAATQAGVILGTAAYMPPEQAKGKPVDHRADIWAFGVVFYELLTGKRLFQGEDVTDTLAAVVMKEADLSAVPLQPRRLIEACLRKDPRKRMQAIGDWQLLLGETAAEAAPPAKASTAFTWIAAAVAAIAILGLGYVGYRHYTEEPARLLSLSIAAPDKTSFLGTDVPAISPDGRHVAFTLTGRPGLWVRDLDADTARQLSSSEGAHMPFWSPDSRSIGFFANAKLKRIELAGGPEQTLADATIGNGGTWSRDNVIVYSPAFGSLYRVSATGGTATAVTQTEPSEIFHVAPQFLPDDKRFLYTAVSSDAAKQGVYLADLTGTSRRQILALPTSAVYTPPGYLLYLRGGTLMAQLFDAGRAEISGEAIPIAESVALSGGSLGLFSTSNEGKVVFTSGQSGGAQLKWFDRSGKPLGTVGPPGSVQWAWLSPDETTVVDSRTDDTGKPDIWLHDVQHGTDSRLTLGQQTSTFPVWSPDSSHVAFFNVVPSGPAIVQKPTKGPGEQQVLDGDPVVKRPTDWSHDGRYIVEDRPNNPKTGVDVWILPLTGAAGSPPKAYPYLNESFNEGNSRISPNGEWLAYMSDATRRTEIYVVTFPNKGGQWQVSVNGGTLPVWSRNGKELFFISPDQKMMSVEIRGGQNFDRGTPKAIFDVHMAGPPGWFDVSKDGRFLIPVPSGDNAGGPLTVLVNWTQKLKR